MPEITSIIGLIRSIYENIFVKGHYIRENNLNKDGDSILKLIYYLYFTLNLSDRKGAKVAIVMTNSISFIASFFVTIMSGNLPVLIPTNLSLIDFKFVLQKIHPSILLLNSPVYKQYIKEDKDFINYLHSFIPVISVLTENELKPLLGTLKEISEINYKDKIMVHFSEIGEPEIGIVTSDLNLVILTPEMSLHSANIAFNLHVKTASSCYVTTLPFYYCPFMTFLIPLLIKQMIITNSTCPKSLHEYFPEQVIIKDKTMDEIVSDIIIKELQFNPISHFLFKIPIINLYLKKRFNRELEKIFGTSVKDVIVIGNNISIFCMEMLCKINFPYRMGIVDENISSLVLLTHEVGKQVPQSYGNLVNSHYGCVRLTPVSDDFLNDKLQLIINYYSGKQYISKYVVKKIKDNNYVVVSSDGLVYHTPVGYEVYPELLETIIKKELPYVSECMLVQVHHKLFLFFNVDIELGNLNSLTIEQVEEIVKEHVNTVINDKLSNFLYIDGVKHMNQEINKSKRYLYLDNTNTNSSS